MRHTNGEMGVIIRETPPLRHHQGDRTPPLPSDHQGDSPPYDIIRETDPPPLCRSMREAPPMSQLQALEAAAPASPPPHQVR